MELAILILVCITLLFVFISLGKSKGGQSDNTELLKKISDLETIINAGHTASKEDFSFFRLEQGNQNDSRNKLISDALDDLKSKLSEKLASIIKENGEAVSKLNTEFRSNLEALNNANKSNNDTLKENLETGFTDQALKQKDLIQQTKDKLEEIKTESKQSNETSRKDLDSIITSFKDAMLEKQTDFTKLTEDKLKVVSDGITTHMGNFSQMQKNQHETLNERQIELRVATEKHLEEMRKTVDEKLQETLNSRLTSSFETVSKQLESVNKGLGEMQTLANDVGGLKKVLAGVKTRGNFGEVQLGMILEQMLAPNQYKKNFSTKKDGKLVEYVICLPGKELGENSEIYLPVDAKFPQDTFQNYQTAHEGNDIDAIKRTELELERAVKSMAKDISEKYINPPVTTDFAIMFLPVEAIYAEVLRRSDLVDELKNKYKIIVTGPTTFSAILTSLQMGFRTLEIQKSSSEVWSTLATVKKEFEKFAGLLDTASDHLEKASGNISNLRGTRMRAVERSLRGIVAAPVGLLPNDTDLGALEGIPLAVTDVAENNN